MLSTDWGSRGGPVVTRHGPVWCYERDSGSAATTLLHGFPTHSQDWEPVLPYLKGRILAPDLLGFGASAKPKWYSFGQQIDALLDLWEDRGITTTRLVCHDYSVSIAQEILWRRIQGNWDGPTVTSVAILNGGLAFSAQRPLLVQRVLRGPAGPLAAHFMGRSTFVRSMQRITGQRIPASDLEVLWRGVEPAVPFIPALSKYHFERRRRETEWLAALQHADIPVRLMWGLDDPVSGRAMFNHVARHAPACGRIGWEGLGHYPHLEDPARIGRLLAATAAP